MELRKKIFKIHNREVLDQYFCEAYDEMMAGVLEDRISYWNERIIEAYLKYGTTEDEDFPFIVYESPFYDNE